MLGNPRQFISGTPHRTCMGAHRGVRGRNGNRIVRNGKETLTVDPFTGTLIDIFQGFFSNPDAIYPFLLCSVYKAEHKGSDSPRPCFAVCDFPPSILGPQASLTA